MRVAFVALCLLALAACGQRPAQDAAATEPVLLVGEFKAASDTARAISGDIRIERGGLLFSSGIVLFTRTLAPRRGSDVISRDGDSYAAAALGPADLVVELRRVTDQTVPHSRVGLCGAQSVEYIALAYETRAQKVTALVFTGDEPPGPQASRSRLCASYAFAPPAGARTTQGIVL